MSSSGLEHELTFAAMPRMDVGSTPRILESTWSEYQKMCALYEGFGARKHRVALVSSGRGRVAQFGHDVHLWRS